MASISPWVSLVAYAAVMPLVIGDDPRSVVPNISVNPNFSFELYDYDTDLIDSQGTWNATKPRQQFLRGSHTGSSSIDSSKSIVSNQTVDEFSDVTLGTSMRGRRRPSHGSQSSSPCGTGLDCNELIDQIDDLLVRIARQFTTGIKANLFCQKAIYHFRHSWLAKKVNVFCIRSNQVFGPTASPRSDEYKVRRKEYEIRGCFGYCNKDFLLLVAPRGVKWTATNTDAHGWENWGYFGRGHVLHEDTVRFY